MITVRVLTPNDVHLMQIVKAAVGDSTVSTDPQEYLSNPSVIVILACIGSEPAGIAHANVIYRPDRPMLMLYEIDVAENYRKQGVGRAMVEHFKLVCTERGFKEMFVLTNKSNFAAMSLYTNTGGIQENVDDAMFVYPID